MSTSVTLPALGESVTEGTVSRWLKQVGDTVEADEPLLEVSTDKVDTEIPSPTAGVLLEIRAQEDETVEVGAVLAVIGDASEQDGGGSDAPADEPQAAEDDGSSDQAEASVEPEPDPSSAVDAEKIQEAEPPSDSGDSSGAPSSGAAASGTEVTLPALGESVTEGTVSRWLKEVGDAVEADEPLLEVSTDKVDTEIPSPVAGTLLEIRVQEDETVEVGAVLAVVGDQSSAPAEAPPEPTKDPEAEAPEPETATETGGEEISEQTAAGDEGGQSPIPAPAEAPKQAPAAAKVDPQPEQHGPSAPAAKAATPVASDSEAGYVTPLVRKLAKEHGIDLSAVTGTGVGGRVRKQDVLAAAEEAKKAAAAPPAPAPSAPAAPAAAAASTAPAVEASSLRGTTEKMSRLRKTIARRMVESLQVSAQLTTVVEVDLTNVSRLRARVKDDFAAREGVKLSYLPFLVKAAVEALKTHPKVNATIDTEAGVITYPAQ